MLLLSGYPYTLSFISFFSFLHPASFTLILKDVTRPMKGQKPVHQLKWSPVRDHDHQVFTSYLGRA